MNQKMLIIFGIMFVFTIGWCIDDRNILTKTVVPGEDVTLTCNRQSSESGTLFWIRLAAGNLPEVLGATYTFDNGFTNKTPRIIAKQEPGTFILHVTKTQLSDTAFYYCEKHTELRTAFLNITFLRVKEPERTIVFQDRLSDPVHPGDSVTLQCSVLLDLKQNTCPGDHSVYWFRAASDQSHPSFIYAHANIDDKCETSPSSQKCVYSFPKNSVGSSDAGTYYCAVATCGEIIFGSGTKLEVDGSTWCFGDCQRANSVLFLLCVTLILCLLVIAVLIYIKKNNQCFNVFALQKNTAAPTSDEQSQHIDDDTLVYTVPNFARRTTGQNLRRSAHAVVGESIYDDVRVLGYE
ncbi:uncharacterized protein LOC113144393 isoform X2 [Mastacembelus armatus]|uniref:Uncharacterized LOC113144393 n=1 Tax=Mastacembelus armatus TaxID=205130 RepID=A0A3Q3N389_9TELE|nr:uncharacterized protein LOC113144393 isoform X2 [Mastacembelus armatus]